MRLSRDEAKRFRWVRDAEAKNNERFAKGTFVGESKNPSVRELFKLPIDGSPVSFKDSWVRDLLISEFAVNASIGDGDFALAYGRAKFKSEGEFIARRQGVDDPD